MTEYYYSSLKFIHPPPHYDKNLTEEPEPPEVLESRYIQTKYILVCKCIQHRIAAALHHTQATLYLKLYPYV